MFPDPRDCAPVIELVNERSNYPTIYLPNPISVVLYYKFSLCVNKNKFFAADRLLGIAGKGIFYKNTRLWQFNMFIKNHIFHLTCKKKTFRKFSRIKSLYKYSKDPNNNLLQPSYEHLSISILAFFHSTNMLMELFRLFLT